MRDQLKLKSEFEQKNKSETEISKKKESERKNKVVVLSNKKRVEPQEGKEKESAKREGKTKLSFYAKENEVRRAFMADQAMVLLVFKESYLNTNETNQSLPSMVVSLLQEFDDVFPQEVPSGLPPIRGIKQQINFVLGTVIPNRPAYRSNPDETKELQRQVEELMGKGMGGKA